MCIRDRSMITANTARTGATLNVTLSAALGVMSSLVSSFRAVSYTHLRAHETVLDLVCRLLLEKKNNQLHESKSMDYNANNTIHRRTLHKYYHTDHQHKRRNRR